MDIHDIEFKVADVTSGGTFSGYGSVYGVLDQGDDIVAPGAFTDSLAEWVSKGRMPAMLWQHRSGEPIGTYTAMREDGNGLYCEGKLALKTQRGAEAYELLKMGAISGLSIGFMTREDTFDQKTGIRTIKRGDLWECSLVTFPMNDQARVASVKGVDQINDFKSAERFLREAGGFSRAEATAIVARIKSLQQGEPVSGDEMQQLLRALSRRKELISS